MTNLTPAFDPARDLVLERVVDVPPELVWKAWTVPEHVVKWFTPAPWTTVSCQIDLRVGGTMRTVMRSPEGQEFPNVGCFLEIVPHRRLVMTDCLLADFRPSAEPFFTAAVHILPEGQGTRYIAHAMHRNAEGRERHEKMGFTHGWGKALDQLVQVAKTLPR